MKRLIIIAALLVSFYNGFACSCGPPESFCTTHTLYDLSASCVVVDAFAHGISLKLLQVFHGTEERDTIKLWDLGGPYGPPGMCNDSTEHQYASYLGGIGDTLILALPKIDSIRYTWDVIGDYRTPGFQCDVYQLLVKNKVVLGKISGSAYCSYLQNCLTSYNYDDFLIDFPIKRLSCQTWLTTPEALPNTALSYYPNPASDRFTFTTPQKGNLTIINNLGQWVESLSIMDYQTKIPTDQLPNGVYFLLFQTERHLERKKLIVQR